MVKTVLQTKLGKALSKQLKKHGWEIIDIEFDTDWWAEEYWLIHSVRENFGLKVILSFLVFGEDIGSWKGKHVEYLTASLTRPTYMNPRDDDIAVIHVSYGLDGTDLEIFFKELDSFREDRH